MSYVLRRFLGWSMAPVEAIADADGGPAALKHKNTAAAKTTVPEKR